MWQSKRLQRVVKSTLAAETSALLDVAEAGIYVNHLLTECLKPADIKGFPIKCYLD